MDNGLTPGRAAGVGMSLTGFRSPGDVRAFCAAAEERGLAPLFELSYNLNEDFLAALSALKAFGPGRVVSVHAPCPSRTYFPNLGSRDTAVVAESLESVAESARTAARFGAANLVLHPGYTFDEPVHRDALRRLAVLKSSLRAKRRWIQIEEGSICRPEYCRSEEYRLHLRRAFGNLKRAARLCSEQGVSLCAENMNPRVTYLFQTPADLLALCAADTSIRICLDLGHLWLSSLVHGFDYLQAVERLCLSGRVSATHIHDNRSTLGDAAYLADEHASIGGGAVPLAGAVALIRRLSGSALVAETVEAPLENLTSLQRLGMEEEA